MAVPVYSHGGPSMAGFPAVIGNTTNSGNPVYIANSLYEPVMMIFFTGTSCTVFIDGNGGAIDSQTGLPPSGEWVDFTGGSGYALTTGQQLAKCLPRTIPCWRTRISAIVAGTLISYVPSIVIPDGQLVSAGRPGRGSNVYSPNA